MLSEHDDKHISQIPLHCQDCAAREHGICSALTLEELIALSKHTRVVQRDGGRELYSDGEPVQSYANIVHGVIKLIKTLEDGRQQIVGLQFAPDFLGRPFATDNPVSAVAASKVELCTISKTALEGVLCDRPAFERRLMRQVLADLDQARDWMVTLGRKTAAEKVASFLYLLARESEPNADAAAGERDFELCLTRAEIADFLGLTIETVSRQITRLRADGVIGLDGARKVHVADIARLKARCG